MTGWVVGSRKAVGGRDGGAVLGTGDGGLVWVLKSRLGSGDSCCWVEVGRGLSKGGESGGVGRGLGAAVGLRLVLMKKARAGRWHEAVERGRRENEAEVLLTEAGQRATRWLLDRFTSAGEYGGETAECW